MARNRTLLPGIAVSLLLHAGLIALFAAPKRPAPQPDTRRTLVWITPRAVPPATAIVPSQPDRPEPAVAARRDRAQQAQALQPPVRARHPAADEPAAKAEQPPAMAVLPATAPEQAAAPADARLPADPFAPAATPVPGKFDANAAMKSARKLATAKATKDDPAVAQLYDKPLYGPPADTPLGTAVGRTARADCKNAAAGAGILALVILPVMILTDKKDSGCKW